MLRLGKIKSLIKAMGKSATEGNNIKYICFLRVLFKKNPNKSYRCSVM